MTLMPEVRRRAILRFGIGLAAAATAFGGRARAERNVMRETAITPVELTTSTLGMPMPSLTNAAVMVAGPADAATNRWASLITGPLAQSLRPGGSLAVSAIGGRDGVTGANAFEALINPDGSTALLVPGSAAVAWLAGDPRVHFDAGRWVPALTSFGSAVLLARAGPPSVALRVAASTPSGVEIAALLGLSLLGRSPSPVFGLSDPEDAIAALRDKRVDAILLTGRAVPERAARLRGALGLQPIFSLGAVPKGGHVRFGERDAALPDAPTMPELFRAGFGVEPSGMLFQAFKATAAAARLDAALLLQPLTPASLVAQWRAACTKAIADTALSSAAQSAQLHPLDAPDCVAALSTIVADENTLLALRRWIASRPDLRPA